MEAIAALSFACNVIQLVEFSSKVIVGAEDLYRDEATTENRELKEVTESLQTYTKALSLAASAHDRELNKIAENASDIGKELVELLNGLTVAKDAENRKWRSVCVVIKGMHKSGQVKALDERLQRLQRLLNTRLLILIRESNATISGQIEELTKTNEYLGADMTKNHQAIVGKLADIEKQTSSWSVTSSNEQNGEESLNSTTTKVMDAMQFWPDLQQLLQSLSTKATTVAKERQILHSLYDSSLTNRYFTVEEEYMNTFRWIFDNPDHGFANWLESGNGVYWITGKAGSGKSTLMKFIHEHAHTRELLSQWVGSRELLIVHHFFWNPGTELQKSYDGLLRSLLFQILRKRPTLIPILCGRRIEGDEFTIQEPWTIRELTENLQRLTHGDLFNDAQVCIFVDGLDEYGENPADVITPLQGMALAQNFKFCVSSRPWPVFEKAFGAGMDKLRVEDLTKNDIQLYVEGRLSEDEHLKGVILHQTEAFNVVKRILWGAEGVFLWVKHVVNLLLRDAANEPTIADLLQLVKSYPRDLDALHERMFQMIQDFHPQQTAEILQICNIGIYTHLPLPIFRFLEMERDNPCYATDQPVHLLTEEEVSEMQAACGRAKARCMDFIEVRPHLVKFENLLSPFHHQISFTHRSIVEFLKKKKAWLEKTVGPNFDASQSTWRAQLACMKVLLGCHESEQVRSFLKESSIGALLAATSYELKHEQTLIAECGETYRTLIGSIWKDGEINWFLPNADSYRERCRMLFSTVPKETLLLAWIASFGPSHSFERLILQDRTHWTKKKRLQDLFGLILTPAILVSFFGLSTCKIHPKIIIMLLKRGADPNAPVTWGKKEPVWCLLLSHLSHRGSSYMEPDSRAENWTQIILLLLDYGADTEVKCDTGIDTFGLEQSEPGKILTVDQILENHFPLDSPVFQKLRERRSKRHAFKRLLKLR